MKIYRARPQLLFTFDNWFSSTGWAVSQSVRYIFFRLQPSYLSATSHTGRNSCRAKSLYMKRFWLPHAQNLHPRLSKGPQGSDHLLYHKNFAKKNKFLVAVKRKNTSVGRKIGLLKVLKANLLTFNLLLILKENLTKCSFFKVYYSIY